MIGQTISHYKILEKLGEGGMGVVYKAEDTKLGRTVALKFLPPHLNAVDQDKARFVQEAKAAATLNHPNICTIHDIQDLEGQMFIVMEFVDGQTLREKRGTISFKQAIDIGIQVADGLAAAHEKGIVHRDIKPENIMIRKDGIAQIMDFGLAKLRGNVTRLTKEGSTVGTAGYMSPEQVQGQDADHRSDIFSFGVLMYELLTEQMPFKGVHETALMYEIVNVDAAPMSSIKPDIDPSLDAIVLECLEKDINERAQSIKQISVDLKRYKRESSRQRVSRITAARPVYQPSAIQPSGIQPSEGFKPSEGLQRSKGLQLPWIVAAIFSLASLAFAVLYFNRPSADVQTVRSYILPPEKSNFANQSAGQPGGQIALSPDGTMLAFVAADSSGRNRLWVRHLNALAAQPLTGTEGAYYPFWSPDNRFIGFFAAGKLRKIEASGGPPLTICDATSGRGGSWNEDGIVLFSPAAVDVIYQVSAAGGVPTAVTQFDTTRRERTHRWPQFLPDGKRFLYFARTTTSGTGSEEDAIRIGSLDGKTDKRLLPTHSNMAYAAGYLFFLRERTLMAQPFDVKNLELTGDAVPVAEQVQYDVSFSKGVFTVSQMRMLAYQGGSAQSGSEILWYDRSGKKVNSIGEPAEYANPRLSPDAKKIALDLYDPQARNRDVWIYDLIRERRTRFTFDQAVERNAIWSPDGSRIIFSSDRKRHLDLYQKTASGAGSEELLLESNLDKGVSDWSSDGRFIVYASVGDPKTKTDMWVLPLFGDRKPVLFLQTEFNESGGRFSPDVKWIAYQSDETGQSEVYVRPFPGPGEKWQVSTNGGFSPSWRRDGKSVKGSASGGEIYYFTDEGKLMAAEVKGVGSTFEVGNVHPLFDLQSKGQSSFHDVTADGQRFLVQTLVGAQTSAPVTLVTNWDKELKKK